MAQQRPVTQKKIRRPRAGVRKTSLMIFLYNLVLVAGLILFLPLLFVKAFVPRKYRGRMLARLGFGLAPLSRNLPGGRPRFWIHALSVGEVTSAVPLVKGIRQAYPNSALIFSAATMTGETLARQTLAADVDLLAPFPLDFYGTVTRFQRCLAPDLFILVETDFWPNFLHGLKQQRIPALLVNGRISARSHDYYKKLRFLFQPLFSAFAAISTQTATDAARMTDLGVPPNLVHPLGNLKYAAALPRPAVQDGISRAAFGIPATHPVLLAGSTHAGEEKIILAVYSRLRQLFPQLRLILAPRHPARNTAVLAAAHAAGLVAGRRSATLPQDYTVLVLDTIGELAAFYSLCDLAFIGGSLVAAGGHNPLEAAAVDRPVLFGPHMEDFQEIAAELVNRGGGRQVNDSEELFNALQEWLTDVDARQRAGQAAGDLVRSHGDIIARHLALIQEILAHDRTGAGSHG
ncbi:MAG: hypothetical protein A2521_11360 [Deltaproteobacteria bacterium RIFOXYD12_FULL_57_12]|nr:MAG: hypothetical protein A2521_11360 [Deltaproteobacteria bacterium RIFOXYD12_FULL_57_12]